MSDEKRNHGRARLARPNSKRTGEISEAAFLHKAVSLGLKVTKPWGDSERYDFVVDSGTRLWRVQIKSTSALHAGGYQIQPIHHVYGERKLAYTSEEIDALAAHIVPLDVWYVLPVNALGSGTSLRLYPDGGCKTARFEQYREAWNLLLDNQNHIPQTHEATAGYSDPPAPANPFAPADSRESAISTTDGPFPAIVTPIAHFRPMLPPVFARYLAKKKK
jgi:PD-(D/E)XK endonuclease